MGMVIVCDGCASFLDREEVLEVQVGRGSLVPAGLSEPRFVGSELPSEYVLCAACAAYLERCLDALRGAAA